MSGLRKLFKRKTPGTKSAASTEDLSDVSSVASGYFIPKDKDLPKLHKAVWSGDISKVKQLAKKGDINQLDKDNRWIESWFIICSYSVGTASHAMV